ncbi:hypothetical protein MTO96_038886 [Rhipicephalus appendiculatus]
MFTFLPGQAYSACVPDHAYQGFCNRTSPGWTYNRSVGECMLHIHGCDGLSDIFGSCYICATYCPTEGYPEDHCTPKFNMLRNSVS